jgi:aminopeptidase-like protein
MKLEIKKLVKEELSGENAKAYVEQISRFHRVQASTMFHQAAEHVKAELVKNGFQDATIEQFKSDGAKRYGTHISPVGWTVKSAELRLVEPEEILLCRFEETPTCLHTLSNATPPEGVTAELIDVGKGTRPEDYKGKNVKDKLVLATGRARYVHEQAVYKFGAAGVITDTLAYEIENVRESVDIPDAHSYQSIWPDATVVNKVKFGFSISKRQGNHLRTLLKQHKVVKLQAKVDAKLFPSKLDVVTATIKGSTKPKEEVFLIAHLCHPQPTANDNASGSGLLLEIARTINALVKTKKLQRPRRTIRFMWVPETHGTAAYLFTHKDWINQLIAGINLDMVGENQELCKSTLTLDRTPDALPSYLNDLAVELMEQSTREFDSETNFGSSSTFRYAVNPHTGGSDHHEFVDPTIGVPCIMFLQWPDMFYHTSMDTIDKVSTDSLRRVGWMATVAALTLANAEAGEALLLAYQTCSRGIARIEETQREAIRTLYEKTSDHAEDRSSREQAKTLARTVQDLKNKIEHVAWREKQAVSSVKRLAKDRELEIAIQKCVKDIETARKRALSKIEEDTSSLTRTHGLSIPAQIEETEAEKQARSMIPKRRFKGTLAVDTFRQTLGIEEFRWYEDKTAKDEKFPMKRAEMINFTDGKRTLHDIIKAVRAEYSELKTEDALKFIRDLEKTKFITVKTRAVKTG